MDGRWSKKIRVTALCCHLVPLFGCFSWFYHFFDYQMLFELNLLLIMTTNIILPLSISNILLPFVIWMVLRKVSAFVDHNARESFNLQGSMAFYSVLLLLIIYVFFGPLSIPVIFPVFSFIYLIFSTTVVLYASWKALRGLWHKNSFVLPILR